MKQEQSVKNIKSQCIKATDMVDYREGAIISRELIKNDGGNVTLFAFDKNEGLSEHVSPYDAVAYVFDGQAEVVIGGKPFLLSKDEMVVMPAQQSHAIKAVKKFKMMLIMIRS
jgi:quercetin dioxygenase-like cupin family protein